MFYFRKSVKTIHGLFLDTGSFLISRLILEKIVSTKIIMAFRSDTKYKILQLKRSCGYRPEIRKKLYRIILHTVDNYDLNTMELVKKQVNILFITATGSIFVFKHCRRHCCFSLKTVKLISQRIL